jgi:molybdate/tungstate transport system substrate-binding protein
MIEKPGFAKSLLEKDRKYMRSKETDLIPLLEKGEIDYIFLYRSVASQHGLNALLLSDSVNLKNPALNEFYSTVSVTVAGKTPTDSMVLQGQAITYGITMPRNGENPVETTKFLQFVMQQKELWASMGQPILEPVFGVNVGEMPEELKEFEIVERN